ncbi:MAG: FecR domain-containing protein [Lysobacterales bacterium]
MKKTGQGNQEQDPVGQLLSLVGQSEPISPATTDRVRQQVATHWRQSIRRRQRSTWLSLAVAASMLLTAGVSLWIGRDTQGAPDTLTIASAARIVGVAQQIRDGDTQQLQEGLELMVGDGLTTTQGQVALRWRSGHEVRLNQNTQIQLDGPQSLTLQAGEIYVQGPGLDGPITVHTTVGPIRDIGTQFMVHTREASVDIAVREGEVSVTRPNGKLATIGAGFGLNLIVADDSQDLAPKPLSAGETQWQWAFDVAPGYDTHDKTADDFLRWLVREKHWELRYADSDVRRTAKRQRLRGQLDPEGNVQQWLNDTLRTVGLTHELRERTLHISRRH